jgi:hypothetical protein
MLLESELRWTTALFGVLGGLCVIAGLARLCYVRRRDYQAKESIPLAIAPSLFAEAGLAPSQLAEARRGLAVAFHRALPWIFIGMGAGWILAGLAELALLPMIHQRILELIYTSYDYLGLETVDSGIITTLLLSGLIIGTGVGVLLAVGLAPRDASRTQPPARGITDLISPIVVAITFAPTLIWLGFALYCVESFPVRQTAEPLLESFPWLPYAGPVFMTGALLCSQICAGVACRMKPHLWVGHDALAAEADRYCRTRLLAMLYWIPWPFFALFSSQLTTLGALYSQIDDLFYPLILVYFIISMLGWLGTFFLFISASHSGQLGGRLNGWWWQQRVAPPARTMRG